MNKERLSAQARLRKKIPTPTAQAIGPSSTILSLNPVHKSHLRPEAEQAYIAQLAHTATQHQRSLSAIEAERRATRTAQFYVWTEVR